MTFGLLVEGYTERAALQQFLRRALAGRGRTGIGFRTYMSGSGGNSRYVAEFPILARKAAVHGFVFGLLDLHRLPATVLPHGRLPTAAAVSTAKRALEERLPSDLRSRVRQHFAVHEVEAWILAGSAPAERGIEIPKAWHNRPEELDGDQPPSARLDDCFRPRFGVRYDKAVHGPQLLARTDPAEVLERCPHFRLLVEDIEAAVDENAS